jgi:hypothetical protein
VLKTTKFLLAIAWMIGVSGVAHADTVETFSHTTPTQSVPFMDTFLLDGFNTSLGTLDGITITLDATGTAEVDVFNAVGSPESFTGAKATLPISLTGPAGVTTAVVLSAGPLSGIAAVGFNTFPGLPDSVTSSVSVLPADFVSYEGLGLIVSVIINAGNGTSGLGTYTGSSVPGVFFGGSSTAGAVTTVSYAYDPSTTTIPEPATMSLLGGALLGISFFLKRFVTPR